MSIFKKLFGTDHNKEFVGKQKQETSNNSKRIIFDFFQIDLKSIPDESFIAGENGDNVYGQSVQNFRKSLDYKECGIFDTIEVKVIDGTNKMLFLNHLTLNK